MGIFESIGLLLGSLHVSAIFIISVILLIFLTAIALSFVLRSKYERLFRDLEKQAAVARTALSDSLSEDAPISDRFSEPRFKNSFLRGITSDFAAAFAGHGDGSAVNTQAIIENHFNRRMRSFMLAERFTRHSVSVMIVLGLLGTFIGLTLSVQSLVVLFRGNDVTELLSSVESGLLSSLGGMSTAFTTSLFGIACSVIVTLFNIFVNAGHARERLMTCLEEYLDNTAAARMKGEAGDGYEKMNLALRRTFIDFGERIAERFDRTLTTMQDDLRGINDANANLRNTIELMNVSTIRIADALKDSTRHIDDNYRVLGGLSERFSDLTDEYEAGRRENAENSGRMMKSVGEACQAVSALTRDLREESQKRLDDYEQYNRALAQMAQSAELIRTAVAAIPDQMYAYGEMTNVPNREREGGWILPGSESGQTP